MTEILGETRIRAKNEITIPKGVREILNLSPGDLLRFEQNIGTIHVCKAITRKVNNNCGGKYNGDSDNS